MSLLLTRGRQLLDYEQKIQKLKAAKSNSISELNAELRQLETDRKALREELNAQEASYKPRKEDTSRASSLSSILSMKFITSSPKIGRDPMSAINSKRMKIEKMDALITQNIELRKKEEVRQLQIQKILKEIKRIVDSISEIDRNETEKSKMEIWCIHSISKLYNEINDAKQAVENYKKAIPLLIEAQKTIVMICTASEQNINDEHLQKLTFNQIQSNSLIADTCLAQAWNYLSMADPQNEETNSSLPPLPEDIIGWAREVVLGVDQLLQATMSSISKKEKLISDHEAELIQIEEQLYQERRLVLIEAANGSKSNLPAYNDIPAIQRMNTSSSNSNISTEFVKSSEIIPPLPPRTQSVSLHGSRQLFNEQSQKLQTSNDNYIDKGEFTFPSDPEPDIVKANTFEKDSRDKIIGSSFSLSDSVSNNWDDIPGTHTLSAEANRKQSPLKEESFNNNWELNTTAVSAQLEKPITDSWSHNIDDIPTNSYEPPLDIDPLTARDTTVANQHQELEELPKLPKNIMGLEDNPWN